MARRPHPVVWLLVGIGILFLFPGSALAAQLDNVVIESLKISSPSGDCEYTWEAVVKNNNPGPVTRQFTVQGAQGDGEYWAATGGVSIAGLEAKEAHKISFDWVRKPNMTMFKVELRTAGARPFARKSTALPPVPAMDVKIGNVELRDDGYTVIVRNRGTHPVTDLRVQCHKATAPDPENWSPCGGAMLGCVPAGGTGTRNATNFSNLMNGYVLFRYTLYGGGGLQDKKFIDTRGIVNRSVPSVPTKAAPRRILDRNPKDKRIFKNQ